MIKTCKTMVWIIRRVKRVESETLKRKQHRGGGEEGEGGVFCTPVSRHEKSNVTFHGISGEKL